MQAYRIYRPVFTTGWYLPDVCPRSRDERVAGGQRRAVPGSPGHARRLDAYPHCHRRRRR